MSASGRHAGHRARLRQRAQLEGLDSFQPHEVLELMLFPAIPQRDVNLLAHELIDRFGSVGAVLAAGPEALCAVPGLGKRSAEWLGLLGEASARYEALRMSDRPLLDRLSHVRAYCDSLLEGVQDEQLWIFSMSLNGRLLGSTRVAKGDWRRVLRLRELVEPVLRYRAQTAVLVQRRMDGNLAPRPEDVQWTHNLSQQLILARVRLLDSLIMGKDTCVSLRKLHLYRMHDERSPDGLEESGELDDWFL